MTRRGLFAALGALVAGGAVGHDNAPADTKSARLAAETMQGKLDDLLAAQDRDTVFEMHIDGNRILHSLKKLKRERGGDLGLA